MTSRTPRTLYRGGRIYSPAEPDATALLVDGGRIEWLGADADAPVADEVVPLDGAVVTPAFVDAHVHTTDTGLARQGLDLTGTRSAGEVLDAVAAYAAGQPADAVLIGHGWDESGWPARQPPSAAELDRAGGGRAVYLSQACIHSAVVSSTLLKTAAEADGFDSSGWLRREAHHAVREVALRSVSGAQRAAAQEAALRHAASLGIAAVHECAGPGTSSEDDLVGLLARSRSAPLPRVFGYWGELGAAAKARELGAVGAGGDLYADGALGSRTAHLSSSYLDGDTAGYGYLTAEQVTGHVVDCMRHGIQAGFHAIGDAAIRTVLDGFAAAAATAGLDRLRDGRHRIEHVEIVDRELIRRLVEFGVVASVQPAFDRLWGGEHGMYAQRLGVARSMASNPIGAMAGVGVALAFGSDSPVTPLDPWGSVLAAMTHHNPAQRIGQRKAFAAHTRGGWRALGPTTAASARSAGGGPAKAKPGRAGIGVERSEPRSREQFSSDGALTPGAAATFAIWSANGSADGLPTVRAGEPLPTCRRTVLDGQVIYDVEKT
jgi:predicted amidohydrolase YtcJ